MLTDLELLTQIKYHDVLYWQRFSPIITDEEYDALVAEANARGLLGEEEPQSLATPFGNKIQHTIPMLSLEKGHTKEDIMLRLKSWNMPNPANIITYRVMPKVDGISASVKYDQAGNLEYIATRGRGGLVGEDVTRHAKSLLNLPMKIAKGPVIVRGELVWRSSEFERFKDSFDYSNARNAVAGMVLSKDPDTMAGFGIMFVPFDVVEGDVEIHQLTEPAYAFKHIIPYKDCDTYDEVWKTTQQIQSSRHLFDYKLDGVVIAIPQKWARRMLGNTNSSPRWAIAYKFSDKEYKDSTVKEVIWHTGRTGVVTPVVSIEPVELYETEVSNVTAHNYKRFKELGLRSDSVVSITKGGEIIPYIHKVVSEGTGPLFEAPVRCPECQSVLQIKGVNLVCTADNCVQKIVNSLLHWCSKSALDIEGIGEVLARHLVTKAGCVSPLFLYTLTADILSVLPRMGGISVAFVMNNIIASTKSPLNRVLCGIGIPGFGEVSCKAITNTPIPVHLSSLVSKDTRDSIVSYATLPNNIKQAWCAYWDAFTKEYLTGLYMFMEQAGFNLMTSSEEPEIVQHKLNNTKVFVTGSLAVSRSVLTKQLSKYGCEVISSTSSANYFLVGTDVTPKKKQMVAKAAKVNDITMSPYVYFGPTGFDKFLSDFEVSIR